MPNLSGLASCFKKPTAVSSYLKISQTLIVFTIDMGNPPEAESLRPTRPLLGVVRGRSPLTSIYKTEIKKRYTCPEAVAQPFEQPHWGHLSKSKTFIFGSTVAFIDALNQLGNASPYTSQSAF